MYLTHFILKPAFVGLTPCSDFFTIFVVWVLGLARPKRYESRDSLDRKRGCIYFQTLHPQQNLWVQDSGCRGKKITDEFILPPPKTIFAYILTLCIIFQKFSKWLPFVNLWPFWIRITLEIKICKVKTSNCLSKLQMLFKDQLITLCKKYINY